MALVGLHPPVASAQPTTWDNTSGDYLWNTIGNWNNGVPTSVLDALFPTTPTGPMASPIVLTAGSLANSLEIRNSYQLIGGDLTLSAGGSIFVERGYTTSFGTQLIGANGLTKSGFGTLVLTNNSNSYTGTTLIDRGSISISAQGALGLDLSDIIITGTTTRGVGGGQLVVGSGWAGTTFSRGFSISGGGPSGDGMALLSVGNNTFTGNFTTSTVNATRFGSTFGMTTLTGTIAQGAPAAQQFLIYSGNGNWTVSGTVTGGANAAIAKQDTGTMILSGDLSGYTGLLRVDGGSIRVTNGLSLPSGNGTIQSNNGGFFEIRTDAPASFSSTNVSMATNSLTLFVDNGINSTTINQTVTFGTLILTGGTSRTLTINGLNDTNVTFAGNGSGIIGNGGAGNNAFTNNSNGTVTYNADIWNTSDATSRVITFGGNGNQVLTGSILASGGRHILSKSGTGTLEIQGTASTFTGYTSISGGTLRINGLGALGNALTPVNINNGALDFVGSVGETTAKVFNLSGTTAPGILLADQSGGTPLIIQNSIGAGGAGIKSLVLGGSNTADNEIQGFIDDNSGTNLTSVYKRGTGTWVYAPNLAPVGGSVLNTTASGAASTTLLSVSSTAGLAVGQSVTGTNVPAGTVIAEIVNGTQFRISINIGSTAVANATPLTFGDLDTFSGSLAIANGTFKVKAVSGVNALNDATPLIFDIDDATAPSWGRQTAGGRFEYLGLAAGSAEALGALTLNGGASTVHVVAGTSGTAELNFSMITIAASLGSGVNFTFDTTGGGTAQTIITGTAGFVSPRAYFEGSNFAFSGVGAVLRAPVYGTDAGFVTSATALTGGAHNEITGSFATDGLGPIAINSLKINGAQTLTLADDLTIGDATGGGILQTGGAGVITTTGAFGLTTGSAGDVVIRTDGPGDSLTISAPILSTTTGGLTKNGPGTLILDGTNGANAYTGATTINEGVLQLQNSARLGGGSPSNNNNLAIRQGATLDVNGHSIGVGAFNGAGTVTNSSTTTSTLTIGNNNQNGTFSGIIQDGGVGQALGITKAGTGTTMALTGLNTYSGVTTINAGTLQVITLADIGVPSSIGTGNVASNAASLVFDGGALQYTGSTATIYQPTATPSVSINRLFTLAGNGTIDSSGQFGNSVLATGAQNDATLIFNNTAPVAFSGTGSRTLTLTGNSNGDNLMSLQLINNPNAGESLNITKAGVGRWVLTNESNSYDGLTTITGGALRATDGTTLPANSPLVLNGGVFATTGTFTRSLTTAPIAGGGGVNFGASGGGFAGGNDKLTVNIGGVGGTLTWGTGGFQGPLILNSADALSEVELVNPIDLNGTNRTVNVLDNTTTSTDFAILSGVISGSNALIKTGAGHLMLLGANTYTGNTSVQGGQLTVTSLGGSTASSSIGGVGGQLNLGTGGTGVTLNYVGPGETSSRVINLASSTGTNTIDASGSGALVLTSNFLASGANDKTLTLAGRSTDNNEIQGAIVNNSASNITAVTKADGGVWILSGQSTFTGAMTVNNGQLGIGASSVGSPGSVTSGPIGRGTFVLGSSATIFAHGEDRVLFNNVTINNTDPLFLGFYSLTFNNFTNTNNNVITNNIVEGKFLEFTGNFILADNNQARTQTFNGSGFTILSGVVQNGPGSGADAITMNNAAGTLRLTNNNTYSGTTTLTAGNLEIGHNSALGTGTLAANGGTVTAFGVDRVLANNVSVNGNGLTFIGTNSLTFGNLTITNNRTITNTISGPDTLTFTGTVTLAENNQARTLIIAGSGTTIFEGVVQNGPGTGNDALRVNGTGAILRLSNPTPNTNTYTGATTISEGTLQIGASEVIPDGVGVSNLVMNPVAGATAILDLNGNNETINGLTATAGGAGSFTIIDNTSASAASLTFGNNDVAVNFGGAAGAYEIKNSGGGPLSIVKTGTGAGTITSAATLTYTGGTTVNGGSTFTINPDLNGTSSLTATGAGSILNAFGNVAGPASITADTGGVVNLTAATFGTTAGAALSASASGTGGSISISNDHTSGTLASITANAGGVITLTGPSYTASAGASISASGAGGSISISNAMTGGDLSSLTAANGGSVLLSSNVNWAVGASISVTGTNSVLTTGISTTTANVASVQLDGGSTLDLSAGAGTPYNGLSSLSLGAGAGTSLLILGVGNDNATSDRLASSSAATTANAVRIDVLGLPGFGNSSTYDLISASSGLSGAVYSLGIVPFGYTLGLNLSDSLVELTVTGGAANSLYWDGSINSSWMGFASPNTNFTTDAAGTTNAMAVPGPLSTVIVSSDIAPFTSGTSIDMTLDSGFTIDSLQFRAFPAGITTVSIAPGAGGSLSIAPVLSTNGIDVGAAAGAVTITAPVNIGANQTWNVDGTAPSSLLVSGNLSGSNSLDKTGAGSLTLNGFNTGYTGTLTLSTGQINIDSPTALGTGTFTIAGGSIDNTSGGAIALTTATPQNWNADFAFVGSNPLDLGPGAITPSGDRIVTVTTNTLTVSGAIEAGGSGFLLTKAGAGTLVLTNSSNNYSGGNTVTAGALQAASNAALGTAASTLTLNGGAFRYGAIIPEIGGPNRPLVIGSSGGTLDTNGFDNTLTLSNLTIGGNVTKTGVGILTVPGALTFPNNLTLSGGQLSLDGVTSVTGALSVTTTGSTLNANDDLTVTGASSFVGNVQVNTGSTKSITMNGAVTVGNNSTTITTLTLGADSSFVMDNSAANFVFANRTTARANVNDFFDASLARNVSITANNVQFGTINVQPNHTGTGPLITFTLPTNAGSTSTISAATKITVGFGEGSGAALSAVLNLGGGNNAITTPLISIGEQKTGAFVGFQPGSAGSLTLSESGGDGKTDLIIGKNPIAATGTNPLSTFDLTTTGVVIAALGDITLATGSTTNAGGGARGTLTLDASGGGSTVTADSVRMGTSTSGTNATYTSTFNLLNGTFQINLGGSGFVQGGGTAASRTSVINVSGGVLDLNGAPLNAVSTGAGTSTLNLTGGVIQNALTIGTFNTLSFTGGEIRDAGTITQSVAQSGATSLLTVNVTKTTAINGNYGLSEGVAVVNGTLDLGANVATIASGGTLMGTGSVTAGSVLLDSAGILAPGASIGTLTVNGNFDLAVDSNFSVELGVGDTSDLLIIGSSGILDFTTGANLTVSAIGSVFEDTLPHEFIIASVGLGLGPTNIAVDGTPVGGNVNLGTLTIGGSATGPIDIDASALGLPNDSTLSLDVVGDNVVLTVTAAPEPMSVTLLGAAGLGAIGWVRRRRANRREASAKT